jgi:hypothetical protein
MSESVMALISRSVVACFPGIRVRHFLWTTVTPMDTSSFQQWLDAYRSAWCSRNPSAAAALYATDGTYQVTPFLEPLRGSQAILDYWTELTRTEENISFAYEILTVTEQFGIAHWHASFVHTPPGLPTKLDGIFLIRLNAEGKCTSLREWWHKQQ